MSQHLFHRSLAVGLAALLTLATMGALDFLAQPDQAQGQLARAASGTRVVQAAHVAPAASRS
jgi:hypothetical protein